MNKPLIASHFLTYISIAITYLLFDKNVVYTLPILIVLSVIAVRRSVYRLLSSLVLGPALYLIYSNFLGSYYVFSSIPISLLAIHGSINEINVKYPRIISFQRLGFTSILVISASVTSLVLLIFDVKAVILTAAHVTYLVTLVHYTTRNLGKVSIHIPDRILGIRDDLHEYSFKILNRGRINIGILIPSIEESSYAISLSPSYIILKSGDRLSGKIILRSSKIGRYTCTINIFIYDTRGLAIKRDAIKVDIIIKPKLTIAIERARRLLMSLGVGPEVSEEIVSPILYGQIKSRSGEFIGCREYIPGDDPRAIHIKKSVEKQKLIVKEYEQVGTAPIFIIVDVGVSTPEELDEVLYNTIQVIIYFILNRRMKVSIVVYNDKGYLVRVPGINPVHLLKKFITMIDRFSPANITYKFDLDERVIAQIRYSNTDLAKIHMKFLLNRFVKSILYDVLVWVNNTFEEYAEIYVIKSGGRYLPLYPIFKLYCENLGHRVTIIDRSFTKKLLVYS